jgi:hypothetical protein
MKEGLTYQELIRCLKDPSDPLFGGSLAYIQVEESLALLEKLLEIKLKKPSDKSSVYQKIILVAEAVSEKSHILITEDGANFAALRNAASQEEKDEVVKRIYPEELAFLHNLLLLSDFVQELADATSTSIKYDFLMIRSTLEACFENLTHILLYEVSKMTEGEERDKYELAVEKLSMDHKIKESEKI